MIADKIFEQLSTDYLKWKYKTDPLFASYLGLSDYDSYVKDFSKESLIDVIDKLYKFKSSAENIVKNELNSENKIDRLILLRDIELLLIKTEKIRYWEINPQLYLDEALDGMHILMLKSFRPEEEITELILKRLRKVPEIFENARKNLKNCPPVFIDVSSQTAAHGADFINIVNKKYGVNSFEKDFNEASRKAIDALLDFKYFLSSEVKAGKENSFAIGKENFSQLLKYGYMVDKDVDTILETGEKCFADISVKLTNLAAELDKEKSWYEIYKMLQQENPGSSGFLNMYLNYMMGAKQFLIDNDIVSILEGEVLDVDETPSFIRPLIPVAAYVSPGPYDKVQKGIFWVTPSENGSSHIGEHNIYTAKVTAPHEAYPGHHLQLCYSNLQKSKLRKQAHSDIFVEGWGLYCEEMMKETGFLKGPKLELAQQVDQLMRAARVIIDVRLHTRDMTLEEAKQFLTDIVLVSSATAGVEVNRYSMTPTQPLSYMIGQLEILKLREDYKKLKGNNFTMKDFHDKMLSCGSLPIKLIRHIILKEEF